MRRMNFKKQSRILVIDDNHTHACGIKELIINESRFDVIATAMSASLGIAMIKKYKPDIVLMDINMPDMDGITAIQEIEKLKLDTKIIVLTAYDECDLIYRAMKVGAKGYISKTMASAQLIYAIEEVENGKIYLPQVITSKFFEYFQKSIREEAKSYLFDDENLLSELTHREEEVLDLLTQGATYKNISQKLFIAETTVKTHVNNIFQKLQVNDRTQAVLYALNHGFNKKKVKAVI